MRKKSLLSVGAIALALGLGVTAMNAAGLLSLPFASSISVPTDATYLRVKAINPESGSVFAQWQNFNHFTVQFTDANPGTFKGIEINRQSDPIKVLKGSNGNFYDDAVFCTIDPADEKLVYVDAKYEGMLHVVIPEQLTISSRDMVQAYQVVLPEGLVHTATGGSASMNPDNPGVETSDISAELKVEYSLNKFPEYTTSPRSGQTCSTMSNGLKTVTIDFGSGVTLAQGENYTEGSVKLNLVNPAAATETSADGSIEEQGTYSMSFKDSSVVLTWDGDAEPATIASPKYYQVVIPEGSFTAKTASDFFAIANTKITINNLGLVWLDSSVVELLDEDEEPVCRVYENTTDIPTEIFMEFPNEVTAAALGSGSAYLNNAAGTRVANYTGELLGNKTTVVWTMVVPTSLTQGHPEYWLAGNYTFYVGANKFTDPQTNKKNPLLTFPGIVAENGLSDDPMTSTSANSAYTWKASEAPYDALFKTTTIEEKNFGAIDSNPGVYMIKMGFLNSCRPDNENTTAVMSLTKKGATEPLVSINPGSEVNTGHLYKQAYRYVSTTPVANTAWATANSSQSWYFFYGFEKDEEGNDIIVSTASNPATSTIRNPLPKFVKSPGTYVLHADKGFFVDKSGLPSAEVNIEFTIIGDIDYTLTPAAESHLADLTTIDITYPEGAKVTAVEGAKVQLQTTGAESSKENPFPWASITAKDNVVTFTFDASTPLSKVAYKLDVPAAQWTIDYDGMSMPNPAMELRYFVDKAVKGTVAPAPNAGEAAILATDLSTITYTASSLVYSAGTATLYSVTPATDDAPATRVAVATFKGSVPQQTVDDTTYDVPSTEVTFTANTDLSDLANGTYEFEIPASALTYSAGLQGTEAYVYTYELKNYPKFKSLFDMTDPAPQVYAKELYGKKLSVVSFSLKNEADASALKKAAFSVISGLNVTVLYEGEEIGTIPANESCFWTPAWGELEVDFLDMETEHDMSTPGTYTIVVPTGYFTYNGEPLQTSSFDVTILEPKAVDFSYTLDPEAASEVESLDAITLKFTAATCINYASNSKNPVATLTSEDGTVVLDCVYPATDNVNTITLKFGDTNTAWVAGKYTLTVHPGCINLDDQTFDDSEIGSGNFEGFTAEYTLTKGGQVEWGELTDYINLALPASFDANMNNTRSAFGQGMGIIGLNLKEELKPVPGAEFITYQYLGGSSIEPEMLATVNPNAENQLMVMGAGIMDESDLPSFTPRFTMYMLFANDGEGGVIEDLSDYQRDGYYIVTIPDGAFQVGDVMLKGTTLTYNFKSGDVDFKYPFTITPADGTEIKLADAAATFFTTGVKLTIEGANFIDSANYSASLTMPDGTELGCNSASSNYRSYLTWKFGTKNTEWPQGTYTFAIKAGMVGVDMGWYMDDWEEGEGNFPATTCIYKVSETTGVTLIGIEPADSYTVYTLDGKVVKLNASAEQMLDLAPGFYIVNGKKTAVRK